MDDIYWKFQIRRATNLSSKEMLGTTHSLLFENGYRIIRRTDNTISFDNGSTGLTWVSKHEAYLRLDKGTFQYITYINQPTIKFTYFISFITELVFLILITFFAIVANYLIFLGFIPFAIQFAVKINIIKNRTNTMLLRLDS